MRKSKVWGWVKTQASRPIVVEIALTGMSVIVALSVVTIFAYAVIGVAKVHLY